MATHVETSFDSGCDQLATDSNSGGNSDDSGCFDISPANTDPSITRELTWIHEEGRDDGSAPTESMDDDDHLPPPASINRHRQSLPPSATGRSHYDRERRLSSSSTTSDGGPPITVRLSRVAAAQCYYYRQRSVEESIHQKNFAILKARSSPRQLELLRLVDKHENPYKNYLLSQTCYNILPIQGTLTSIDSRLKLNYCLANLADLQTSLIWHENTQKYASIYTRHDHLQLLAHGLNTGSFDFIMKQNLAWWIKKDELLQRCPLRVHLDDSLYTTWRQMYKNKTDHAVVRDSDNDVIGIISTHDILTVLQKQTRSTARHWPWINRSLGYLFAGTNADSATMADTLTTNATVAEAVLRLSSERVDSVPIVDADSGRITAAFSTDDALQYIAPLLITTTSRITPIDIDRMKERRVFSTKSDGSYAKRPSSAPRLLKTTNTLKDAVDHVVLTNSTGQQLPKVLHLTNCDGATAAGIAVTPRDLVQRLVEQEDDNEHRLLHQHPMALIPFFAAQQRGGGMSL